MDFLEAITRLPLPGFRRCPVPRDLEAVTDRGFEDPPAAAGTSRDVVEGLWERLLALYRTGAHPGIQLCVRCRGATAIDRAVGFARGGAPGDPPGAARIPMTTHTPVNLFSAAKAVTAMVIHKLEEQGLLHLDDRVCEYIPEFGRKGKERMTIRHVVSHKAGIPNLPEEAIDLELLAHPEAIIRILCELEPRSRPGLLLAYHAVSGGFVLAEVVRRATGRSIREILETEIRKPLGLEWLHYGVGAADVPRVARNAVTGPPLLPPVSTLLHGALGLELDEVVELSNDPRFLMGVIPSANVLSTARDSAALYQCLLNGGVLDGRRIFEPRTVHHAIDEQTGFEIDLTLLLPIAYSLGFMLGNRWLSLYGWNHPEAFGHLGLTNIFCWADPERDLVVAMLTTGKPVISAHALRIMQLIGALHEAFPVRRAARGGEEAPTWPRAESS